MKSRKKAAKKTARRKVGGMKSAKKVALKPSSSKYTDALAYLVSSEENEIKLMVASSMGLVSE